jgi:hypothetical protein
MAYRRDDERPDFDGNDAVRRPRPGWGDRCDRCGACFTEHDRVCRRHPRHCGRCDPCGSGHGKPWHGFCPPTRSRHDCEDKENLEAIGSLPAIQYLNDLLSVTMTVWQPATMRAVGIWQNALLCRYHDPAQVACDVAEMWSEWSQGVLNLAEFPFQWHTRRHLSIPSFVFMVDEAAETTVPQSAPTPINAQGLPLFATDLQMISGTHVISEDHVQVELLENGNRVQVTLVNLGEGQGTPNPVLQVGRYVGAAYALEHPHRLPLALVYLFVVPNALLRPNSST